MNWIHELFLIARSKRLRRQTRKALREMKEQEKKFNQALDDAKDYIQREKEYLEGKKGGKK